MKKEIQGLGKAKKRLRPYYNKVKYGKIYPVLNMAWLCYGRPLIRRYHTSRIRHLIKEDTFQDVKTFCMFMGHSRSGHSLISALLDAHPDIVLSDDLDALKYIDAGFGKTDMYHLILAKSHSHARAGRIRDGRRGKAYYSYAVPGQWQGTCRKIQIIGDKKGGMTAKRLTANPGLLQQLRRTVDTSVKLIVVIRNPYDNISTRFLRHNRQNTLMHYIDNYFSACRRINDVRKYINPSDILFVRHEAFIENPEQELTQTCRFLGAGISAEYAKACASIVYKSPVKSRHEIQWEPGLIEIVRTRMARFDFLAGYSYEN
ncbi:sulfotransferase [Desulfonema magnum]|uniref:Sulfotransferase domain-containing protein n=1 Tax=Desulfonema magnum TaxID=45655 RepID=A0A975GP30_9BACT|nr:sulfotransferase [Desulfonema magnum]QTA88365.1 Sulfotransferase domain-containing protein [Desulfonema magnum]